MPPYARKSHPVFYLVFTVIVWYPLQEINCRLIYLPEGVFVMQSLGYGIIGCGMMGREHIRNIQLLEKTAVTAIYEPDAQMRAEAKSLVPDAVFTSSLEDVVGSEHVDCLVVASPNHLHKTQFEQIQSVCAKPLLMEKPLFTNPADRPRLLEIQNSYHAPVWIGMEYRYMPPIARLLEDMEDVTGELKMVSIREHRFPFLQKVGDWNRFNKNSGGTFVEKCCHFFDLMRLMTKSEAVSVMASAGQAVNHLDEQYDGLTPDIWDHGYVIVNFENGVKAMLELCMFAEASQFQEEISVVGPAGKIEAKVPGPIRFWPEEAGAPPVPELVISRRFPRQQTIQPLPVDPALLKAGDHNGATFYQHQKFAELVRNGGKPEVGLEDGLKAVDIGMAAQTSAETGQTVYL